MAPGTTQAHAIPLASLSVLICAIAPCRACEFVCGVEGCTVMLRSLSAYDAHYQHWHTFKCEVCGLQLPNNRLLEMHLAERHDELFRCMAKTRKMVSHCARDRCGGLLSPRAAPTWRPRLMRILSRGCVCAI